MTELLRPNINDKASELHGCWLWGVDLDGLILSLL